MSDNLDRTVWIGAFTDAFARFTRPFGRFDWFADFPDTGALDAWFDTFPAMPRRAAQQAAAIVDVALTSDDDSWFEIMENGVWPT